MRNILLGSLLFITLNSGAQENIQAEAVGGKPYVTHTVSSGETLSGLARIYKLNSDEIAVFNKMNTEKGLQKGQSLRIPLKPANLTQTECSGCRKVYYKVQPKEGLYRIGLSFGSVPVPTLQKLNNLNGESVDIGQNLLVGYLSATGGKAVDEIAKKQVEKEVVKPKEDIAKTDKKTDNKVAETLERAEPPLIIEKSLPLDPKQKDESKTDPVNKGTTSPVIAVKQNTANTQGTGLFTSGYEGKAGMAKTGTAATFKSTSGWEDAKYYALMSNAEPGTVIKVSNTVTGKTVYAKILGELPAIKQNENMLMRISNSAAAALGGGEDSLSVTVNY